MYVFAHVLDVRYNDDHTDLALQEHLLNNSYFDSPYGSLRQPSSLGGIIKSFSPVGVERTLLSHGNNASSL